MKNLMVVDDHEVVRKGVTEAFSASETARTTKEASSILEAVDASPSIDIVVAELHLRDGSGLDLVTELNRRGSMPTVIIHAAHIGADELISCVCANVQAMVLKTSGVEQLVLAVTAVANGSGYLDPYITEILFGRIRERHSHLGDLRLSSLSPQERRILSLVSEGLTNRMIARRLQLAEKTVRNYVSNVLCKLGVSSRTEAAVYFSRKHHPHSLTHEQLSPRSKVETAMVLGERARPMSAGI